jgi:ParB-like chromosome segregation protein Spo0J
VRFEGSESVAGGVPIKRRATLEQKRVDEIAASILDKGLQAPIRVRADGARFVLVEGLHRLEAAKLQPLHGRLDVLSASAHRQGRRR